MQISHGNLRIFVRIFGRLSSLGAAFTAELVGQVQRKGTIREVSIVTLQLASAIKAVQRQLTEHGQRY